MVSGKFVLFLDQKTGQFKNFKLQLSLNFWSFIFNLNKLILIELSHLLKYLY